MRDECPRHPGQPRLDCLPCEQLGEALADAGGFEERFDVVMPSGVRVHMADEAEWHFPIGGPW